MSLVRNKIKLVAAFLLLILASAADADPAGISLGVGYVPVSTVAAATSEEEVQFSGQVLQIDLAALAQIKSVNAVTTIYVGQRQLVNAYTETDADSGAKGEETLTSQFLGFSLGIPAYTHKSGLATLMFTLGLGVNRLSIEQSGATPEQQAYGAGVHGKVGVELGPNIGRSGFYARYEAVPAVFFEGKDLEHEDRQLGSLRTLDHVILIGGTIGY